MTRANPPLLNCNKALQNFRRNCPSRAAESGARRASKVRRKLALGPHNIKKKHQKLDRR